MAPTGTQPWRRLGSTVSRGLGVSADWRPQVLQRQVSTVLSHRKETPGTFHITLNCFLWSIDLYKRETFSPRNSWRSLDKERRRREVTEDSQQKAMGSRKAKSWAAAWEVELWEGGRHERGSLGTCRRHCESPITSWRKFYKVPHYCSKFLKLRVYYLWMQHVLRQGSLEYSRTTC